MQVLHRDLKPANVLLGPPPRYLAKVADFGESLQHNDLDEHGTLSVRGTPAYVAPEVLRQERYGGKADVYSFGACLVHLATRKQPYSDLMAETPTFVLMQRVASGELSPCDEARDADWPEPVEALARRCCAAAADSRPSFDEVLRDLVAIEGGRQVPPKPGTAQRRARRCGRDDIHGAAPGGGADGGAAPCTRSPARSGCAGLPRLWSRSQDASEGCLEGRSKSTERSVSPAVLQRLPAL